MGGMAVNRRVALLAIAAPLAVPVLLLFVAAFVIVLAVSGGSVSSAAVPPGGVTGGQLRPDAPVPPEYAALIRGAVAAAGCPALTEAVLAAQLQQESNFDPPAVSPAGAQGIAQFLPGPRAGW